MRQADSLRGGQALEAARRGVPIPDELLDAERRAAALMSRNKVVEEELRNYQVGVPGVLPHDTAARILRKARA